MKVIQQLFIFATLSLCGLGLSYAHCGKCGDGHADSKSDTSSCDKKECGSCEGQADKKVDKTGDHVSCDKKDTDNKGQADKSADKSCDNKDYDCNKGDKKSE